MGYKRLSVVLSFVVLFLIGTPVWWKTTDTYRSNVDFSKILSYNQSINSINETIIWPEFKEFLKYSNQIDHDKQVKSSTSYCLSFTLLNSDPESVIPSWNFPDLSKKFIEPFINEISDIANFTIQSKISHYANLLKSPMKSESTFIIPSNRLSEYINPNEWRLETTSTNQPTLNFIIYIPNQSQSPLYIIEQNEKNLEKQHESNSFLIPQWGGITIHNVNINTSEEQSSTGAHIDLTPILEKEMKTFIYQMKELLGITSATTKKQKDHHWNHLDESDKISAIKSYIAENIKISISTLLSLEALIESLPNMLILDNIQEEVALAISSLESAHQCLLSKDYQCALRHSKISLDSAESAFFDKNMLSQLYFPDEHKYAIYTPLFVPVCFPIIAGLFQEIKHRSNKRKLK